MARRRSNSFQLPFEALLIGSWLALTVAFWVAASTLRAVLTHPSDQAVVDALEAGLAFRVSLAEVVLGGFLCMLTVRRQARGPALLLPFAAFLIALLMSVVWIPMHRIARASSLRPPATTATTTLSRHETLLRLRETRVALDVTKILMLTAVFVVSRPGTKR